MDQARTTITKIFNGEPLSYTRFNLTQNMEEDASQVEMKLSSDMDEDVGGNGVVDNGTHHHPRPPYISKPGLLTRRNVFLLAVFTLAVFLVGWLIGYAAHKKPDAGAPSCTPSALPSKDEAVVPVQTVTELQWSDISSLLKQKLTTSAIEKTLSEFTLDRHQAGSAGDEVLGNLVWKRFQGLGMNFWSDAHYVKIQTRPGSGTNRVTFLNKTYFESGYLAYSATGTAEGAVLYAHYGREDDLNRLQELNVDPSGRVLLVRAGRISFAEKVANAVSVNASAVLIYLDPVDYSLSADADLFGHVHLGTGDPYTPGFPSFNHTQFPPARSSGLPSIPAQSIRASTAAAIMRNMGGRDSPRGWSDGGLINVMYRLGALEDTITVQVDNVPSEIAMHNVFGVIKGFVDPDRYVVIGAQRDAWGPGYAKSTVGTSLLLELARVISEMVKNDGFRPRRSIVFASWSGGEYGAVGATEWLEGYLPSLNMKAFSFINLDEVVTGSSFKASASPLMYDLIKSTLNEVSSPSDPSKSLYSVVGGASWESVMEPMRMSDTAYAFQTASGIPSVSFRFTLDNKDKTYPFFGTMLDTRANLEVHAPNMLGLAKTAGELAGHLALRLVHDHLLRLKPDQYINLMRVNVARIGREVSSLQRSGRVPATLQMRWFTSATGSYSRAARGLLSTITDSDLEDPEQCRIINDRLMMVERNLLSPYVSPRDSPFRHILLGAGSHTLDALLAHLSAIKDGLASANVDLLKNQFALATWTIQSCANALAGNIWELDNEI